MRDEREGRSYAILKTDRDVATGRRGDAAKSNSASEWNRQRLRSATQHLSTNPNPNLELGIEVPGQ